MASRRVHCRVEAFGFGRVADSDGTGVVFREKCAAISWRLRILSSKAAEAPKAIAPSTHTRNHTYVSLYGPLSNAFAACGSAAGKLEASASAACAAASSARVSVLTALAGAPGIGPARARLAAGGSTSSPSSDDGRVLRRELRRHRCWSRKAPREGVARREPLVEGAALASHRAAGTVHGGHGEDVRELELSLARP